MKKLILLFVLGVTIVSCKENKKTEKEINLSKNEDSSVSYVNISPISHATAVIEFEDEVIYLDPTGGKIAFEGFKNPSYILITDIHGDHMNVKTLNELDLSNTIIIAPKAVEENLRAINAKEIIVMNNGDKKSMKNFLVEAIPMYNLREEALKFHPKGRGNGYVLTIKGERIYFSGDTEDIPEMRSLQNIDRAYICMNLPYTMTVENAADAVLAFKPKKVFPYHYRGSNGMSNVAKFKKIVNEGSNTIEVVQQNWYQ